MSQLCINISLREKEKQIQKASDDYIISNGENATVLEFVGKYVSQQHGVKHNTKNNYNFVINIIKKENFGKKLIDTVRISDAKESI